MRNRYEAFLTSLQHRGGAGNDELVQIMLPLLEEIQTFHEAGKVAPLDDFDTLLETADCLDIDEHFVREPRYSFRSLSVLSPSAVDAVRITGSETRLTDLDSGSMLFSDEALLQTGPAKAAEIIQRPVYLTGYKSYELALGHHDALTDIFLLGLVMASVVTGLNFYDAEDFQSFMANRLSLKALMPGLHPSLANLIVEMTELDRDKRSRDIPEIIQKLKAFRDYNPEQTIDLTRLEAYRTAPMDARRKLVFQKLRSRLFDTSRRNRLLYFKSNMRFLNLTVSSFPLSLQLNYVKPEHLFYWNTEIAGRLSAAKSLHLNKYLKTDENAYILPSLDKIRLETQRDIQEYGMSPLRLAIAFLHWYNLKDGSGERISSPFILLPAKLIKKKSLRSDEDFMLEPTGTEAEINPILRWMLEETYSIHLPDRIDLATTNLRSFYEEIRSAVEGTNQGIKIALVDKPRIKIIHAVAQRTASVYARRSRKRKAGMTHQYLMDYSYDQDNYHPLGLQLFRAYVQPNELVLEGLSREFTGPSKFRPKALQERDTLYELADGADNPHLWEFDLCHTVLGNFNYRKMSLVRDYDAVLANGGGAHIFQTLFSEAPKEVELAKASPTILSEQFPVVSSDPTQMASVLKSHHGKSYIIQGPPGTGKSQTITNLIADLLARDKKVLFVCEKKAAIDVVYHRLKSRGLHHLCCLIHDSQEDKRAFIADLKLTYEDYLKGGEDLATIKDARAQLAARTSAKIGMLQELHQFSSTLFKEAGKPVYQLLNRLLELEASGASAKSIQQQLLPSYKSWLQSGVVIHKLTERLSAHGKLRTLATHPVRHLNTRVITREGLSLRDLEGRIRSLRAMLSNLQSLPADAENLDELAAIAAAAHSIRQFAVANQLFLIDAADLRSMELDALMRDIEATQRKYGEALQANKAWKQKLPESEARTALPHIERLEGSFFKFLNGTWRRISKVVRSSYDFSSHSIRPSVADVVKSLLHEYEVAHEAEGKVEEARSRFGLSDLERDWQAITALRRQTNQLISQNLQAWKDHPKNAIVLSDNMPGINAARDEVAGLWNGGTSAAMTELDSQLESLLSEIASLPDILHYLEELESADEGLKALLRTEDLAPEAMEQLLLKATLRSLRQRFMAVEKFNAGLVEELAGEIAKLYDELMEANAAYIRAAARDRFMKKLAISQQSATGMSQADKETKKAYTEGRRKLEHEIGKSRAHDSIRNLGEGATGQVLRDLKPVWLMSPLSVSATLPLGKDYFDVVVFDEASQITLEEGVPTMLRAPQSIIVGDEKQMPPSNFFSSNAVDPDDLTEDADTSDERFQLDADSLLTQGARKLESIMLGWHYRSRSESLISYSNAAFYAGGLLTIPDRKGFLQLRQPIVISRPEDASLTAQEVYARTISYHHLPKGLYEERANLDEAAYIAELVRELLRGANGKTIGVVAFSMEQQGAIEEALEALQQADEAFNARLEEEYLCTDEGQFTGLFVKNLENVQGDERDIIIISTCYGYNKDGKMLMNFGPINRKGGEKRLNVIFSRAKEHVVVVSSIQYTDITNEYNEGASIFRRYLQYAQLVSNGDLPAASLVLRTLSGNIGQSTASTAPILTVTGQIKTFLEDNNWEVATDVGQSVFKCPIAVRRKEDSTFRLGILIDDYLHYSNGDILEQYVQRPAILKSFGWRVHRVLTQDWIRDREAVEKRLLAALAD
jgi:DNA polymerase III delta prime subunit